MLSYPDLPRPPSLFYLFFCHFVLLTLNMNPNLPVERGGGVVVGISVVSGGGRGSVCKCMYVVSGSDGTWAGGGAVVRTCLLWWSEVSLCASCMVAWKGWAFLSCWRSSFLKWIVLWPSEKTRKIRLDKRWGLKKKN